MIFLSALSLVGVFIHRALVLKRIRSKMENREEEPKKESDEKKEEKKINRNEKAKANSLYEKAKAHVKSGKEEEAIKLFVQVLAIDEGHLETQHELAVLYLNKQMFSPAAALFKQLGEATNDPVHYSHLGFAQYQQNEFDEALRAYQKAVDLDDSRAQRFVSLAQVYRAMGNLTGAIVAMNKAIELEPENVDFLFLLADLKIEAEQKEEASLVLSKILSMDAENEDAEAMLKSLEKEMNEKEKGE